VGESSDLLMASHMASCAPRGKVSRMELAKQVPASQPQVPPQERPRQLIGNPAAAGLVTGKVRRVMAADDIKGFHAGEVLVCDAIQPMMTHLVPLAAGIVERRGGMLIHGAIIAREMAIPCVNGIAGAVDLLEDGEIVTVDGHLGLPGRALAADPPVSEARARNIDAQIAG
jgi:phosphoenolpyruvate synthase/pyruvate phosphate dikinase